ncbi:MAG: polysaccharide deacetylase family protein [Candidatus Edwardsbacteria bacterium]
MKRIILFFDTESLWERPYRPGFDFDGSLEKILTILESERVRAVFNLCGILAKEHPQSIRKIVQAGHEIGVHGYRHENFLQLSDQKMEETLIKAEEAIENVTGRKAVGMRAPWLWANRRLYRLLQERGYKWASNQHIFLPERFETREEFKIFRSYLPAKIFARCRWWAFPHRPYQRDNLVEIPLLSSMDGELLDLVSPEQDSPAEQMNFAYRSWVRQYRRAKEHFNLTFHDWLIGTANRLNLLRRILSFLKTQEDKFISAEALYNIIMLC